MTPPSVRGLHGEGQKRPLYTRIPALYSLTPAWARSLGRAFAAFRRGSTTRLVDRYLGALQDLPARGSAPIPVLLTHDVDTAEGLSQLDRLLDLEERLGFRSLNFLVTHRYPLDPSRFAARVAAGHRFGVHDTNHDNQVAYLPSARVRERIRQAQAKLGAIDTGTFRSPAFLRSKSLYDGIAGSVRFDFSSIDSALAWPFPGDGTGSPLPFRHQGIICVPTNLPRDGELLALGLSNAERLELIRKKSLQLWRAGAPAVLLTHPDPGFTDSAEEAAAYEELLTWIKSSPELEACTPDRFLEAVSRLALAEV